MPTTPSSSGLTNCLFRKGLLIIINFAILCSIFTRGKATAAARGLGGFIRLSRSQQQPRQQFQAIAVTAAAGAGREATGLIRVPQREPFRSISSIAARSFRHLHTNRKQILTRKTIISMAAPLSSSGSHHQGKGKGPITSGAAATTTGNGGGNGGGGRASIITDVQQAGEALRRGKLVAFPTETVYGLGANAYNETSVRRIFEVKGRPLTDPLIVHVAEREGSWTVFRCGSDDGAKYTSSDNTTTRGGSSSSSSSLSTEIIRQEKAVLSLLADRFWPGPLTLVAPAAPDIPSAVTAETGWVGVRCPSNPIARQLIKAAGVPVVAPSANRFGHVSPTSAAHVYDDLSAHDIFILDGGMVGSSISTRTGSDLPSSSTTSSSSAVGAVGVSDSSSSSATAIGGEGVVECEIGIESTVAKVDVQAGLITVLRAGAVTPSDIRQCLAEEAEKQGGDSWSSSIRVEMKMMEKEGRGGGGGGGDTGKQQQEEKEEEIAQVAPGQCLRHYAPDRPTYLLSPIPVSTNSANKEGREEWIIRLAKKAVVIDVGGRLKDLKEAAAFYRDLSPQGNAREAAMCLFEVLRWSEAVGLPAEIVLIVDLRGLEGGGGGADGDGTDATTNDAEFVAALMDRVLRSASGRQVNQEIAEMYL